MAARGWRAFETLNPVGVYREENGCGSCHDYAMNSDAMADYDGVGWRSVAGDPWFLRSTSGWISWDEYEAGCWLGLHLDGFGGTLRVRLPLVPHLPVVVPVLAERGQARAHSCADNGSTDDDARADSGADNSNADGDAAPTHEGEKVRLQPAAPSCTSPPSEELRRCARYFCRANYHDLASIHSSSENAAVAALCPGQCWINETSVSVDNACAAQEGTWTWSDGTAWDYDKTGNSESPTGLRRATSPTP